MFHISFGISYSRQSEAQASPISLRMKEAGEPEVTMKESGMEKGTSMKPISPAAPL